jgi:hypothetical protein
MAPVSQQSVHRAVLESAGYDAKSATVAEAEVLLRTEKFDLVIVSATVADLAS